MSESKKRINTRALCIVAVFFVVISALVIGYKVFAEGEGSIVTARINYYYYIDSGDHKGAEARIAFVANMNYGSDPRTEKSPDVPGYKPFIKNPDTDEINVEAPEITVNFTEDTVVDVFYKPIDVPYQIELMQQIINTSEYTSYTIITNRGLTGSVPEEFGDDFVFGADSPFSGKTLDNAFDGFTLMYHQSDTIGADGQTKFRCYYDRNTYNIYFKLGKDGHGVNPLLKQYGYQLTLAEIGTPIRSGFTFKGWAYESAPDTEVEFPVQIDENKTFVAMWEPTRTVGYTVVFRNQDEDNATVYDYWGKWEVDDADYPGESVDVDDAFVAACDAYAAEHAEEIGLTDYQHFTVDAATTKARNADVTLKGDGSTIITVYYTRNSYRIWFVYAREKVTTTTVSVPPSPVTELPLQQGSYIISRRKDNVNKQLTNEQATSPNDYCLQITDITTPCFWTIAPYGETGRFTISIDDNGTTKYLDVDTSSTPYSSNTRRKTAYTRTVDSGNEPPLFSIEKTGSGSDTRFIIYRQEGSNYFALNDQSNGAKNAQFYKYTDKPADSFVKWIFYDSAGSQTTQESKQSQVAKRTSNAKYTSLQWTSLSNSSIPTVTIPETEHIKHIGKYFTLTINGVVYRNYYIELTAKYDSEISDFWPGNALSDYGSYKFGSWATGYNTPYRQRFTDHANIVGLYPYLEKQLINDRSDSAHPYDLAEIMDASGNEDLASIMYAWWGDSNANVGFHAFENYFEALPGESETADPDDVVEIDGITYIRHDTNIVKCAHNDGTRIDAFVYIGFSIFPSEESGHVESWNHTNKSTNYTETGHVKKNQVVGKDEDGDDIIEEIWTTQFHYNRNRYNLTFNTLKPGDTYPSSWNQTNVQFEMPLSSFEPTEDPHYPEPELEQYYEFVGWGLSDTDDTPVDWDTITMPAYDLELFAIWKPREYNVDFYLDEEIMENEDLQNLNNHISYDDPNPTYGSLIDDKARIVATQFSPYAPTFINNGIETPMEFAGWFYFDSNGNLQQFDPETMTIYQDIKLFAQWTSTIPTKYAVHYTYKGTPISDDTEGYSFVGLTRTFKAKFDNQLYPDYRVHYFPKVASSSILMEQTIEGEPLANDKTFEYLYCEKIWYTVRYVEVDSNGNQIRVFEEDEGWSESASVTLQFKPYLNYVPQEYFISKILELPDDYDENHDYSGEKPGLEKNVITFRYVEREGFEPYHIKYLLEDESGQQYGSYTGLTFRCINFIDSASDEGETITAAVQDFVGYNVDKYEVVNYRNNVNDSEGLKTVNDASISFDLQAEMDGVELYIYYLKKTYPVKVKYSIDSADPDKCNEWYINIHSKAEEDGVTLHDDLTSETFTVEEGGADVTKHKTVYEIKQEKQKYNSLYSVSAPNISRFKLTSGRVKELRIVHEDAPTPADITSNSVGFVYADAQTITFYYNVIVPDALGEKIAPISEEPYESWKILTQNKETVSPLVAPKADITAKPGLPPTGDRIYKFVGWYKGTYDDETGAFDKGSAVSASLLSSDGLTLDAPSGETTDQYYFAVYDYVRGDLIINNTSTDVGQYFEYRVRGTDSHNSWIDMTVVLPAAGTKTILELPVGNYTVESTDWQWRYTDSSVDVTVVDKEGSSPTAQASFAPVMSKTKWLDGNGYKENIFS